MWIYMGLMGVDLILATTVQRNYPQVFVHAPLHPGRVADVEGILFSFSSDRSQLGKREAYSTLTKACVHARRWSGFLPSEPARHLEADSVLSWLPGSWGDFH